MSADVAPASSAGAASAPSAGVDLVLMWHMHQPDYRDTASGRFRLPWVYLHALKDYSDMAWHLEHASAMRAVVNFVPVLLDQIEDYADQCASAVYRDPLLALLAREQSTPLTRDERMHAIDQCFHANHQQMIAPFPPYRRLHELAKQVEDFGGGAIDYLSDRYIYDLLVWYHLAWTGETVRRESELVTALMARGEGFTFEDRRALVALIGEVIGGIVGRYRRLAEDGRIELSTTPRDHPLAPLLIDLASAREARPELPLPQAASYPGGEARVAWHTEAAARSHAQRFGARPVGLWPAEGAVSDGVVRIAEANGFRWIASGEQVLAHSLARGGAAMRERNAFLYRPYRLESMPEVTCFFRDDRLSDLIGFEYRKWDGGDAARHFVGELEAIGRASQAGEHALVSVILDGENAWDHYPYNGFFFLQALYEQLTSHATIRATTFRAWLDAPHAEPTALPKLVAGSWVYGDLTTWIGAHDKNAAWDLLVSAKQAFDLVAASGRLSEATLARATRLLAICESSDWCWWFGDVHPARAVASFDSLYRANLAELYRLLGLRAPAQLAEPISRGNLHAAYDSAMLRATS